MTGCCHSVCYCSTLYSVDRRSWVLNAHIDADPFALRGRRFAANWMGEREGKEFHPKSPSPQLNFKHLPVPRSFDV